jgi:hypothetical protein
MKELLEYWKLLICLIIFAITLGAAVFFLFSHDFLLLGVHLFIVVPLLGWVISKIDPRFYGSCSRTKEGR